MTKQACVCLLTVVALLAGYGCGEALPESYGMLLKGGHVIDPKNEISAPMDVAIDEGKIVAVRESLPEDRAGKVVDVSGLYVTPGLIDLHAHVYAGTGIPGVLTGDSSVYPDHFSFRSGCTTLVDVGSSGHRNFEDFKDRVIDRSKTRVLVMLNVAGGGMGPDGEDNPEDMEPEKIAAMAKKYPDIIVGVKTAHLFRARMGFRRASRRGSRPRGYSGHGRLRRQPSQGASDRGTLPRKAPPWRHLHAHVLGLAC